MPWNRSKEARMVRNVQRLGGGLVSVTAISCRASSPGPWWSRSISGSGSPKAPPAEAALGVSDQSGRSRRPISIEPCINGIRVAWFQEPLGGDIMRGATVGDLQERGPALADVGALVVIAQPKEFLTLFFGQGEGAAGHEWLLCPCACMTNGPI